MVAKDELIEINRKLLATHPVIGPDQPWLQIAKRAVRQGHYRLPAPFRKSMRKG
jgi:hypothetical protein